MTFVKAWSYTANMAQPIQSEVLRALIIPSAGHDSFPKKVQVALIT